MMSRFKTSAVFVGVILFVLQIRCVCSEISGSSHRKASYHRSNVVINTDDQGRFLETIYTSRKMNCARACTENAECERYLYCSRNSFCNLYQDGRDCVMSGDTTGCSCYTQMIRCEDSDCTCPSGKYGEGCEDTISDCITPISPYSDEHVIPEFDQSVSRWSIGTNLTYSCSPSYYPSVDWTCKTNGTWKEPVCKAVNSCRDLTQCNPEYSEGTFVVKYPGTDDDMVVQCSTTSYGDYLLEHVRVSANTTFTYYSTNYSASCHPDRYTCGYRRFTAIKIFILQNKVIALADNVVFHDKTTTDCDGPPVYHSGKNCDLGCEIPEPGIFQVDLRGTGLKHEPFALTSGQVVFSDNEQLVTGTCNNCTVCDVPSSLTFLLPANGTDIDYTNTTKPVCHSRS